MDNINYHQNVVTLPLRQQNNLPFNIDFHEIQKTGYQLVRGFGVDVERLESNLSVISGGKLFYSKRLNGISHQFKVLPYSHNLSEQASCGGYHTDFMFQPSPPEFIALLCIKPDPKHPFYGRNQIVHYDAFVQKMDAFFGVSVQDLLELKVRYKFQDDQPIEIPIVQQYGDHKIFRLHTSLMGEESSQLYLKGIPLKNAIEAICSDVAQDVVLDKGDLLIVSNHFALHRRSECTFKFNSDGCTFESREMSTIRFDK